MPAVIGAQRMARMLVRSATAEVIELFGDAGEMQMEMDELTIDEQSSLVGKTVAETDTPHPSSSGAPLPQLGFETRSPG